MTARFARWVEDYALSLLRWALNKTGSRAGAEELSQEVWLQFFAAVRREERAGRAIEKPEHLLWKVARYVWCKHLRALSSRCTVPLEADVPSQMDIAARVADEQAQRQLEAWLHRRIVNLSRIQREALILYYVDQLPQREIARRLGVSESTLRWHLFDTRRKIKEEANHMTDARFVYRPRTLHMGINGQAVPQLATRRVTENLLMQNILCACYQEGRTAQELSEMLGVARPYIEHDLDWLIEQELLTERKGRCYTAFMIQSNAQQEAQIRVYQAHKEALCDVIVRHLLAHEETIRSLGFTGCDQPMGKLLWWLIQHFSFVLRRPVEVPEPPHRPDGGKYWPLGFDNTDPLEHSIRFDWAYNGSMHFDHFYWFGLYNFGSSEIEDLLDCYTPQWQTLRTLLENLILHDFDLSCVPEGGQYALAQLAEKGFVRMENGRAAPTFTILTRAQYDALRERVFLPLADSLRDEMQRLADDLRQAALSALPPHLQHLSDLALGMSLLDLTYITEILAGRDGHLYLPKDRADGEFLTLVYIKP